MVHASTVSEGCRIVEIPEPWRDEKGGNIAMFPMPDQEGITMDRIEFRSDPEREGALMAARRGSREFGDLLSNKNSTNRYRFRLPASTQSSDKGLGGVEAVSDLQWDKGERLTATEIPAPDPQSLEFCPSGSACANLNRAFPTTLPYGTAEPALSPKQRWIAVPSRSRKDPSGGPPWHSMRWESLEVGIYSVASGRLVRRIRGWGCHWAKLRSSQLRGDLVFSIQLDLSAHQLLVCGMRNAD
jgi:hypothetical protein